MHLESSIFHEENKPYLRDQRHHVPESEVERMSIAGLESQFSGVENLKTVTEASWRKRVNHPKSSLRAVLRRVAEKEK
jgi:hypothetical protein